MLKALTFLLLWILLLCPNAHGQPKNNRYVILVSFDGFRYDYVNKFNTPNFKSLISKGAQAEALIPCFPSKTFPNHYSIVTGLYPGHHGLVDNSFYDPDRKEFFEIKISERTKDAYYYGGVPLWTLARQQGLKSASFFWVGSELSQPDLRPDYYLPYDESVADTVRVQQVLAWLRLPESERPHFITLYFSSPDHEGHLYGPSAEETKKAVLRSDEILGILMNELKRIDLPINVIVVSDHGMLELKELPETYIFLNEILNMKSSSLKITNAGTHAHLYLKNNFQTDSVYRVLKKNEKNFSVFRQQEFPATWHYTTQRSGNLLLIAHPRFYLKDDERKKFLAKIQPGKKFGAHGYDPSQVKDMTGIFYAYGPNIKKGEKIAAFQNIHIYPFIAKILNLTLPQIDGNINVLKGLYKD